MQPSRAEAYQKLVVDEQLNISAFAAKLGTLPNSSYVDVLAPLQAISMTKERIYPVDLDGHPFPAGYAVIGNTIAEHLKRAKLLEPTKGH